eukprot:365011-Chlamydomonas_euryale.AAC.30
MGEANEESSSTLALQAASPPKESNADYVWRTSKEGTSKALDENSKRLAHVGHKQSKTKHGGGPNRGAPPCSVGANGPNCCSLHTPHTWQYCPLILRTAHAPACVLRREQAARIITWQGSGVLTCHGLTHALRRCRGQCASHLRRARAARQALVDPSQGCCAPRRSPAERRSYDRPWHHG